MSEKIVYSLSLKRFIMSTSSVYTVRISAEVRRMMDEMKDINWQSDIRQMIEELVREKKRQRLLAESDRLRERTKDIAISASELIREDRDAR